MIVSHDGTILSAQPTVLMESGTIMHPAYRVVDAVARAWVPTKEQRAAQVAQIVLALAEAGMLK